MKVVLIANPAGGVGKTTLAHALAVASVEFGKKTLLMDLDPAGALTFKLGAENPRISLVDLLSSTKISDDLIITTDERFDFIPADSRLTSNNDEQSLKALLASLPKGYDLIFLDSPSTITTSLGMGLAVADLVLAPTKNTIHSLRGLIQLRTLTPATALSIGEVTSFDISPKLDDVIEISEEVEVMSATKSSILTSRKSSSTAESYRSAAYSVLELLGLE